MAQSEITQADSQSPLMAWAMRGGIGWVLSILPLSLTLYFASLLPTITSGAVLRVSYAWIPSLGVDFAFIVDGLSLTFALLVLGIGTLVVLYAGGYMAGDRQIGRFYLYLFLFMGAMVGLVLADNLITLFVFWELTSISSYLLIGYKHAYYSSRSSALQALLITGAGGLALLAGVVLLGIAAETQTISELGARHELILNSGLYAPILILVFIGAFTKSAQFPFQFWLPGAMAAPTPVSAYLHSATMVKAGVFLLARLNPALGDTPAWQITLTIFGAITMALGAYLAVSQTDLKRILAFTTVSSLGTLVMLIGIGGEHGIVAMMVFLIVHSLYKGCLFMVAGNIDHETGSRDISILSGLHREMPITFGAAALAALSMAGLPPLLGFVGKELIYESTLDAHFAAATVTTVAVASNILMIVAAGMVVARPFLPTGTTRHSTPRNPHEPPISMWLGPMVLAALSAVFGLFVVQMMQPIVQQGVAAILGEAVEVKLKLLPTSITGYFLLSVLTVALGSLSYLYGRPALMQAGKATRGMLEDSFVNGFTDLVNNTQAFARWITRALQSGYLRRYVLITIGAVVSVASAALLTRADLSAIRLFDTPIFVWEVATALVILVGVGLVLAARSRLTAVAGLGTVGFGVTLIFFFFSAPDLVMTQFSVETLSVLLFILILYRLPIFTNISHSYSRIRDGIVAGLAGLLMTLITLLTIAGEELKPLTPFYAEASYPEAKGRNVVNVILVDFRGIDTLGEIAVLGIAALGIFLLLKLRLAPSDEHPEVEGSTGKEQL